MPAITELASFNTAMTETAVNQEVPSLSPKEQEVVVLLAQGHSYAQIADQLAITENTLKTHIKRIYRKLKVHNRTQAILQSQKYKLI